MENKVFNNVVISATSNKVNSDFKQEIDTKTAYIEVDEQTAKEMEAFGIRKYTSKEDKTEFFILKLVDKLRVYKGKNSVIRKDLSHVEDENGNENLNFKTKDGTGVSINVIHGENKGNNFHRIQAIQLKSDSDLVQIEPENPFEDDSDKVAINDDDLPF